MVAVSGTSPSCAGTGTATTVIDVVVGSAASTKPGFTGTSSIATATSSSGAE
jgi:hypothetical protein